MKLTNKVFKTAIAAVAILFALSLTGCPKVTDPEDNPSGGSTSGGGTSGGGTSGGGSSGGTISGTDLIPEGKDTDPNFSGTRTEALNFIFNTSSVAETEITITQKSWEELLAGYKDDNHSHANFKFTKTVDGVTYTQEIRNIGIRFRGNTSRKNPISKKTGKYFQRHIALDFNEFNADTDEDRKLLGSAKGYDLKCFKNDGNFAREVLSYNFLRDNGVWTSPRAGFTHVTIKVVNGTEVKSLNFGVYSMIEEVGKQFLKERTEKENGGKLKGNDGYLFKCIWGATLASSTMTDDTINTVPYINEWGETSDPLYFLKTNKTELATARSFLKNIANILDCGNEEEVDTYLPEDLTIRALACDVITGGWDDYWVNGANYYCYFDEVNKNNINKFYYIPYDQDNTFGSSWNIDPAKSPVSTWTNLPLAQALLRKAENVELFKKYLDEFSGKDGLNADSAKTIINKWQEMITPYIQSDDIDFNMEGDSEDVRSYTYNYFVDEVAPGSKYPYIKLLSDDNSTNFFKLKRAAINEYLGIVEEEEEEEEDPTLTYWVPPIHAVPGFDCWAAGFNKAMFGLDPDYKGEMYIRGGMTGWELDEKWKFSSSEDSYFITEPIQFTDLASGVQYKVYDKTANKWYGWKDIKVDMRNAYKASGDDANFITNTKIYD